MPLDSATYLAVTSRAAKERAARAVGALGSALWDGETAIDGRLASLDGRKGVLLVTPIRLLWCPEGAGSVVTLHRQDAVATAVRGVRASRIRSTRGGNIEVGPWTLRSGEGDDLGDVLERWRTGTIPGHERQAGAEQRDGSTGVEEAIVHARLNPIGYVTTVRDGTTVPARWDAASAEPPRGTHVWLLLENGEECGRAMPMATGATP